MNKKKKNQHIFFIFGGVLRLSRIYKDPMLNFSEMFANTDIVPRIFQSHRRYSYSPAHTLTLYK